VIPETPDPSTARDVERLAAIGAELEEVDIALRRLDEERYGLCDVCDCPIDEHRLESDPLTRRCATHDSSTSSMPRYDADVEQDLDLDEDPYQALHQARQQDSDPNSDRNSDTEEDVLERSVGVLAGHDPLPLGREHPEGSRD
jgi:hypothetical protein